MWNDIIKSHVLHVVPNPYDFLFSVEHKSDISEELNGYCSECEWKLGDVMLLKGQNTIKVVCDLCTILQIDRSHAISVWGNRPKFIHWYSSPPPALKSYLCDLNMHIFNFGKPPHENQWYLPLFASNLHAWHYIWFASMQNFSWGRGNNYYIPFSFWYNTHTHTHKQTKSFKGLGLIRFFFSYAHQGCIYLIKKKIQLNSNIVKHYLTRLGKIIIIKKNVWLSWKYQNKYLKS